VMSAVDEGEVGVASGINNTVARVAGLLAVAVIGLVAMDIFERELSTSLRSLDLSPTLRSAVAAEPRTLGDVALPAGATAEEGRALERAAAEALVASFRWVAVLCALLAAGASAAAAATIERAPLRARSGELALASCAHLELIVDVEPRTTGCEECLRIGERWVHLRICLTCGHVGCCDASKRRHATAHFWTTQHPIVRSLEAGETWRWCYLDDVAL